MMTKQVNCLLSTVDQILRLKQLAHVITTIQIKYHRLYLSITLILTGILHLMDVIQTEIIRIEDLQ